MKRIVLLLLLATITALAAVHSMSLHGAAVMLSGNPPNPPICPSCLVSGSNTIQTGIGDILQKNPDLRAGLLEIPSSYVPQGRIESVEYEIVSKSGKRLFHTSDASAKIYDSNVVIELPEGAAKAAQKHFKKGNTLRITLRATRVDPQNNDEYKSDKDEKYKK